MFEQVWNWIVEHIVPLLTASNIALILGFALALAPKIKKIFKDNTEAAATLSKKMAEIKVITDEIKSFKGVVEGLKSDNEEYGRAYGKIEENSKVLMEKLDAVLDIQDAAYGATKISEVRDVIKNIHANARFETTRQRKKMADGAKEAAAKVTEFAESLKEQLVEIEHTAAPKSNHMGSISL